MARKKLIFLAGSPSERSRSSRLLADVERRVTARGVATRPYSFRDFDASALLQAEADHEQIRAFIEEVSASDGLVVSTPVYKATFAGSLKVVIDLVPPDALAAKVGLGIATARIASHLEPTGRALEAIFQFFKVRQSLAPALLVDDQVFAAGTDEAFSRDASALIEQRSAELLAALGVS